MADAIVSGIYRILNTQNGKCYIGSAKNHIRRLKQHRNALDQNKHNNKKLQRAWLKYGESAFVFELVELVGDVSKLLVREQHWIDAESGADHGYNINPTAGSCLGRTLSDETKRKIREKRALQPPMSNDGRRRIIEALKARPPISDATRKKLSLAKIGRKATPEEIEKNRLKQLGKSPSAETREKLRQSSSGRKHSEESRKKMSAWQIGRKMSPEAVAKSIANRILSDEGREKLAAAGRAMKGRKKPDGWASMVRERQITSNWRPSEKMIEASRKANLGKKIHPDVIAKRVATRVKNKAIALQANAPDGQAFQA